jgi:hypothetical protein
MQSLPNDPANITDACQAIIGQPVWGIHQGHGTALFVEFGDPHLIVREPYKTPSNTSEKMKRRAAQRQITLSGRWSFLVFPGTWLLQQDGLSIESDDVQTVERDARLSEFNGQYLETVAFDPAAIELRFTFDLGATMIIGHNPEIDDELLLFTPKGGRTLGLRPDGILTTDIGA